MNEREEIERFNQDLDALLEGESRSREGIDPECLHTFRKLASANFSARSRLREATRARLLARHSALKKPSRFAWRTQMKTRIPNLTNAFAFGAAMILLVLFLVWAFTNTTPQPEIAPSPFPQFISSPSPDENSIPTPYDTSSTGLIVFESRRDGNGEIYLSNANGRDQRNLTNDPAEDRNPVWSPDGQKIAFISERTGSGQIYVMNSDGSGLKQLSNYSQITEISHCSQIIPSSKIKFLGFVQLDWSPDGKYLVSPLAMDIDGNMIEFLFLINADGSGVIQLTSDGNDINPQWSPDGQRIAFSRLISCDGEVTHDILNINPDGTGSTNLTHTPASEITFSWSPDGSRIVYFSTGIQDETGRHDEVKLMEVDGSNQRTLVNLGSGLEFDNGDFAWLTDGERIAFIPPNDGGNIEIKTVKTDGTELDSLVAIQDNFRSLDLSPDGQWLVASADVENPAFYFISLVSPYQYFRVPEGGLTPHWVLNKEEAAVRIIVEEFGKALHTVSLQSPNAKEDMKEKYSPFVAPELLEKWTNNMSTAPGRIVSSPWPDRIEITSVTKQSTTEYSVAGDIIEVTSMEVVNGGAADKIPVRITVEEVQGNWMIIEYEQEWSYTSNLSGPSAPDPLTLDSDSEAIRQRILYSYQNWQTMWVEAQVDDLNGAVASSQRVQVWLNQPAQARILSGPIEGAPASLWISDGEKTRTGEEVRIDPDYTPPAIESDTVYPHPMTGIMPTPLSELLFPSGMTQRGGEYRPINIETVAGREALIVEWNRPDGSLTDRFWVDTVTGVILRDQNYGKGGDGGLTSDITVIAIQYDLELPSGTFDRLAPFPPSFATGPEDIFREIATPNTPGEPDSSLAYGEIYMFLETKGGYENAGLVHFPASCLLTEKPCPKPEFVQDLPAGFLYPEFSLSPDRRQIFFSANNLESYVWIFEVGSGKWNQLEVPFFSGAVWSPDGKWLVGQPVIYGDAQSSPLLLARADGSEWREIMTDIPGFKYARGWLDNDRILLVNTLDNQVSDDDPFVYSEIQIYDLQKEEVKVVAGIQTNANTSIFGTPALSPDRMKVLYSVQDRESGTTQINVHNLTDSTDETSFRYNLPVGADWSPDGAWLSLTAALGYTCEIHLVQTDGTDDRLLFTGDWGGACGYTWSPDGEYMLIPGLVQNPTIPQLHIVDLTTGVSRLVTLPDVGVEFEWPRMAWLP